MTIDYGPTIHLPKTDFPRRAGLAQKEPELQKRWEKMDLYAKQRAVAKGRGKFILHMGPPFANGNIHIGHVLTTVLKDVVCRTYQQLGYDAPLVPGFDCHGLPIEWKVEEKYRAKDKNMKKEDIDPAVFRAECRAFAQGWIDVQTSEFKRIGVLADFKNPYVTMANHSEAAITKEIHKFLRNGLLYRGSKPVMWSIPEQTALAEAEVEYKDHTSDCLWVKFPVKSGPKELQGASVVIWTTTPWTLPANRALAYGDDIDYVRIVVSAVADDAIARAGDQYYIAAALVDGFKTSAKITKLDVSTPFKGSAFNGVICSHPLVGKGYEFDIPLLAGDFVTTEAGTGFVHIAPGHGEDDYRLGLKYGIEVPHTVQGDGTYFAHVPIFAGLPVYLADGRKGPANKQVTAAILENGNLVAKIFAGEKGEYRHSYPHSWRSKAPVIFRNTPQWFFSMEKNDLRKKAMAAIKATKWIPKTGENRIGAMIEGRGDWCVSRQRIWGTPIAMFVDKKTGEPLRDEKVLSRIIDAFEKEGADAWWARPASDFLGPEYKAEDYEQVKDTIDVWFDSGSTQGYVLEERPELRRPADLYLEGSDQHRGWFQSSLLVGCGTRGDAPFKAVLTHGFILDEKGMKMSKSVGNVTSPMVLSDTHGADILRLWALGSDYTEDIRFGEKILQGHIDIYRRVRGTFCYLLGSIDDSQRAAYKDLADLDKYILHRLHAVDAEVRASIREFDFQHVLTTLHNFCTRELSAFYFDICKDTLYCEAKDSAKRRGVVTVLDAAFNYLVHWFAPFLAFTAEEAWLSYKGVGIDDLSESIHLGTAPDASAEWNNPAVFEKFEKIIAARSVVTGALEKRRAAKEIGASLEAAPKIHADTALAAILQSVPFPEICITSNLDIVSSSAPADAFTLPEVPGVAVVFAKAEGKKCVRCWKYTADVGSDASHPEACARCADAVRKEQKSVAA